MNPTDKLKPGIRIKKKYIIEKSIGQGGMAKTYLATEEGSGLKVVLKVVLFSEMKAWKTLELFEREAKTLKNLNHPNIPKYIDDFHIETEDEIFYFIVMEYIEGKNLYDLITDGKRFTEKEVTDILKSLLHTLNYIHTLNPAVIHRDIQPKNIIYHPSGKAYLVDFGGVGQIIKETLYGGSTFIGTFGYFPHEQMLGKSYPSSDLYSLGMTFIFVLTSKEPSNFDLKNGKVYYAPFTNISKRLTNAIDKMVEPVIEVRIKDSKSVLRLLENTIIPEIVPKTTKQSTTKYNPIKQIVLSMNDTNLAITLPFTGFLTVFIAMSIVGEDIAFKKYSFIVLLALIAICISGYLLGNKLDDKRNIFITQDYIKYGKDNTIFGKDLETISMSHIKTMDVMTYDKNEYFLNIIDMDDNELSIGKGYRLSVYYIEDLRNTIEEFRASAIMNQNNQGKS